MTLLSPFIGSPQSHYAAMAIITAVAVVSAAILFGADAMPISQKFFFVILIFLLSIPGILLSLLQLTCLVTGSGVNNKRWWCSLYSWVMSAFIIMYSVVIVVVAIQSLVKKNEKFVTGFRTGANNIIRDYPSPYPPNVTPAPQRLGIAQHEAGHDQEHEADHEHRVLQPFVPRHAQVQPVGHVLLLDESLLDRQLPPDFLQKIEGVVEEHASHHEDDQDHVEARDDVENRAVAVLASRRLGTDVHRSNREAHVGPRVTLAARLHEIGLVHGRRRIGLRFDRVRTVAARAVDDLDRAGPAATNDDLEARDNVFGADREYILQIVFRQQRDFGDHQRFPLIFYKLHNH